MRTIFQILIFYVIWFITIIGPVEGRELEATLIAAIIFIIGFIRELRSSTALFFLLLATGVSLDLLAVHLELFTCVNKEFAYANYPLWMVLLWAAFTGLYISVVGSKLEIRALWISVVVGLIGGPASYFAAERLGAITLHPNFGLVGIGIEYLLVMLLWTKLFRMRSFIS